MSNSKKLFVDIVVANDNSIDRLRELAGACGIENSDWTCEWLDGGRAAFKFKNQTLMTNFRTRRFISGRFNPEWVHKHSGWDCHPAHADNANALTFSRR
jgi:hypothetical protein